MITKELFFKYINNYNEYNNAIERISKAISGKNFSSDIYDSDWNDSVNLMLDVFLEQNFTEGGNDLIYAFLFENDETNPLTLFEKDDTKVVLDTLDKLWDYLYQYKEDYINA